MSPFFPATPNPLVRGAASAPAGLAALAGLAAEGPDRSRRPTRAPRAAPSLLAGLRARRRALAEFRVLQQLRAQDLPVPAARGVEQVDGRWRVTQEEPAAAQPLDRLLRGQAPWPQSPARVAVALGRLLARFHAAGLEHADLDPRHVRVLSSGELLLTGFAGARLHRRLPPAKALADLVRLAAGTRELVPVRVRGHCSGAWHRALPARLAGRLGDLRPLLARVEERARLERRARVAALEAEWLRPEPCAGELAAALRERLDGPPAGTPESQGDQDEPTLLELDLPGSGPCRILAVRGAARARRAWLTGRRLREHHVPALEPLAADLAGALPWAAFGLPPGARPLALDAHTAAGNRYRLLRNLGALYGALHDRGLGAAAIASREVWHDAEGRAWFGPGLELEDYDPRPGLRSVERRYAPCLLYTSPSPRDQRGSHMPSSA